MRNLQVFMLFAYFSTLANANVIYDWETTSYFYSTPSPNQSEIFSIDASWTFTDEAVARGYIRLVQNDNFNDPSQNPTPLDIVDFNMTATSLDGTKIFHWEKSDLPIDFSHAGTFSEAYSSNIKFLADGPSIFMPLHPAIDPTYNFHFVTDNEIDVLTSNDTFYEVSGHWNQRQAAVPEPNFVSLLAIGLAGICFMRRRTGRQ